MKNHYLRLAVPPNATPEELKAGYRRAARRAHPDSGGTADEFKMVSEAYDVLSSAGKRQQYDTARREWAASRGAVLCNGCGAANAIQKRPRANEVAECASCGTTLPVDVKSIITLQQANILHHAGRFVEDVGLDLAQAAADLAKAQIKRLRTRWSKGT